MKPTIGARVLFGFALLLALSVGLGGYSLDQMAELRKIQSAVAQRDLRVLDLIQDVSQAEGTMRGLRERSVSQALLHKDKLVDQDSRATQALWRQAADQTDKVMAELETNTAEYEQTAASPQRREQWGKIRQSLREVRTAWKALMGETEPMFDRLNRGEWKAAVAQLDAVNGARLVYDEKLARAAQLTTGQVEIGSALAAETYSSVRGSVAAGLVVMLLAGVAAALLIQRSIAAPLAAFMRFVERVGAGDLTQQPASTSVGDLDRLGGSLSAMVAGLKAMAGQTAGATQQLTSASAEIMASVQQQAAGTKEQAATVQEITTTMEEISQSGAQISAKAKQVAAGAEATSVASQSGTDAVQKTTRTMALIREQVEEVAENIVALSEKTLAVGEIIATVNDIAERSNLLALNAAIEAAAAGDSGNRFSVVAAEMKNLADQAKESTVQVRSILGDIQKGINTSVMLTEEAVKRVDSGKRQADVTEQTIRQMAQTTLDSIQAFEQIIGAGNQQQIGFEQVSQGMRDIRQAATQTAAATSQVEAAVANLNALSLELKQLTERYKL